MEPKTKKVLLLVEAEVDVNDGFTDEEYQKVAAGVLKKAMLSSAYGFWASRGLIFSLKEGVVSFQDPVPKTEKTDSMRPEIRKLFEERRKRDKAFYKEMAKFE